MTSQDVASGSEITLSNKIDKPLVVYIYVQVYNDVYYNVA